VRRVHRHVVGQRENALVQRPPQRPGQLLGPVRRDQVGPGYRPDQQRPAGEQRGRPVTVEQQVGQVLRGVAGRGQGPQAQPAEVHVVAVAQPPVAEPAAALRCGEDLRAVRGELAAAGHEVGVQVGLGRKGDRQPARLRCGQVRARVAFRVDRQRAAVAQGHQVGAVAQALVDQGERFRRRGCSGRHCLSPDHRCPE
jgi:hypothetical protein